MARSLSYMLFKGMTGLHASRSSSLVSGSFYRSGSRYSTTVPNDPDTHKDFQPTTKPESSGVSLNDVEQDVKENPVMIYMKGCRNFLNVDLAHLQFES